MRRFALSGPVFGRRGIAGAVRVGAASTYVVRMIRGRSRRVVLSGSATKAATVRFRARSARRGRHRFELVVTSGGRTVRTTIAAARL